MNTLSTTPVTVLTGYLGSGKTTLLKRLLESENGNRTAVLINEFGEISLDHLIVKSVSGTTVVLRNGCACCSIRSELKTGLRDLIDGRSRGDIPYFDRILLETTGIADPVPIVQTLVADPMLRNQVHLANLVSTVDGRNGIDQLATQPEAARQAATADRLVITKTDICDVDGIDRLHGILVGLNPSATVVRTPSDDDLWSALLGAETFDKSDTARNWLSKVDPDLAPEQTRRFHAESAGDAVGSFVFRTRRRIDWTALAVWLSLLVHRHGRQVLRVKGLLDVPGAKGPVLLNAIQNFIHPPVHLDGWPDGDRSSRLVFIVQGLDEALIRASLERFLELSREEMQVASQYLRIRMKCTEDFPWPMSN